MNRLVSDIVNASEEQAEGVSQVCRAVAEMERVNQRNASIVEALVARVGEFRLNGAPGKKPGYHPSFIQTQSPPITGDRGRSGY